MPELRIDVAELALEDIRSIRNHTTQRWGEKQAADYVAAIWARLDLLSRFPERGTVIGQGYGDYRKLVADRHIIYYHVAGSTVHIARILHERAQVYPEMLG